MHNRFTSTVLKFHGSTEPLYFLLGPGRHGQAYSSKTGRVGSTAHAHADVLRHLSKSELALHFKRTTRGTKETVDLITQLIHSSEGERGRDTLGGPLINSAQMTEIWKSQRKHVACIQDPPDVQLYVQTGTLKKGGHTLPTFRCARGSTSLESFHLHLNRAIPGKATVL